MAQSSVAPASEVTLQSSPELFAVLCAARAAGLQKSGAVRDEPVVRRVEAFLSGLDPALRSPLQEYLEAERTTDPARAWGEFLSLGLVLESPPEFEFVLPRNELPPGAYERQGFQPLLRTFYAQSGVGRLRQELAPLYEQALAERRSEVADLLLQTRAYLRLIGDRYPGRTYTIFLEWLVPPNLVSSRNFGEHYFLVIHPQSAEFVRAVRHQYLHYLLDPVTTKYAALLRPWRKLQAEAARAPRLSATFREDLTLLVTESLIQAVELRMERWEEVRELAEVDRLEREGYVFTRHFLHALLGFEQEEPSIYFYFPEMVQHLDVGGELVRLQRLEFSPPESPLSSADKQAMVPPSDLLAEAEELLRRGAYREAGERFARFLQEKDSQEARALYGLAIVSSHAEDREQAKHYFLRTVEVARHPVLLGWSHVYLGRLYDLEGDRDQALIHYRAALDLVPEVEPVERAARQGLERPFGENQEEFEQGRPQ